jgi:hypothetical protein
LWAIATLFHMAHSSVFDRELNFALLTVAAFLAIFRPSVNSALLLIVLQLFDAFFRMPITTNHWLFTAFVNLTILQTYLYQIVKNRSYTINEGVWYDSFAPIIKIEVVILYFFAVFHKLNSGFFSPVTSCATDLLAAQNIGSLVPLTPELLTANAYFTVAMESLIPILLCFRKTRNAGILFGIFFHSVLSYSSYNAFYDFSSMVIATYFLFASPALSVHIKTFFQQLKSKITSSKYSTKGLTKKTLFALALLTLLYIGNKYIHTYKEVHLYFFWTVFSLGVSIIFIHFLMTMRKNTNHYSVDWKIAHWSLLLIPIIVFLNGTSPYLGLKTENSYAMFSNLRTEGGISNHFLIPASAQIFNYQKEIIEVVSSTDPVLQSFADNEKLIVLFEFRNLLKDRKPKKVTYRLNGKLGYYEQAATVKSAALAPNSYILHKLMKFRNVDKNGEQQCYH